VGGEQRGGGVSFAGAGRHPEAERPAPAGHSGGVSAAAGGRRRGPHRSDRPELHRKRRRRRAVAGGGARHPAGHARDLQRVDTQDKLPREVLAGIGKEECDPGQLPDPSCTPQPGLRAPGGGELRRRLGTDAGRDRRRRRG
jgi:hypothetical protein